MKAELKPTGKKLKWGPEYFLYIDGQTDKSSYDEKHATHTGAFAKKVMKLKSSDFPKDFSCFLKMKPFVKGCIHDDGKVWAGWERKNFEVGLVFEIDMPAIENKFFWVEDIQVAEFILKCYKREKRKNLILRNEINLGVSVVPGKNETIEQALNRLLKLFVPFLHECKKELIRDVKKFAKEFEGDLRKAS